MLHSNSRCELIAVHLATTRRSQAKEVLIRRATQWKFMQLFVWFGLYGDMRWCWAFLKTEPAERFHHHHPRWMKHPHPCFEPHDMLSYITMWKSQAWGEKWGHAVLSIWPVGLPLNPRHTPSPALHLTPVGCFCLARMRPWNLMVFLPCTQKGLLVETGLLYRGEKLHSLLHPLLPVAPPTIGMCYHFKHLFYLIIHHFPKYPPLKWIQCIPCVQAANRG